MTYAKPPPPASSEPQARREVAAHYIAVARNHLNPGSVEIPPLPDRYRPPLRLDLDDERGNE